MINRADFAKYIPEPKVKPVSEIDRANEAVDIRDIYNGLMSSRAPTGEYSSWKIFCPMAHEHADGGRTKNCRVFPPTHIYCWEMHGYISPVRLYSYWKGMSTKAAARELLDQRGLLQPKNFRERWNDLLNLREQKDEDKLGDKQDAVSALQNALQNDTLYIEHEYSEEVRSAWVLILAKLDMLWSRPETDSAVLSEWLIRSLTRLKEAVNESENTKEVESI